MSRKASQCTPMLALIRFPTEFPKDAVGGGVHSANVVETWGSWMRYPISGSSVRIPKFRPRNAALHKSFGSDSTQCERALTPKRSRDARLSVGSAVASPHLNQTCGGAAGAGSQRESPTKQNRKLGARPDIITSFFGGGVRCTRIAPHCRRIRF